MVFVNKAIFKSIKIRKLPIGANDYSYTLDVSTHDKPHEFETRDYTGENLLIALADSNSRRIEVIQDQWKYVIELTQPI